MGLDNDIVIAFRTTFIDHCIQLVVAAYKRSIIEQAVSIDWEENDVTAQLHEYINKDPLRIKWRISSNVENPLPKDITEKKKGYAAKSPRIDMRFATFRAQNEFLYFIEAKNLKEKSSSLKRRYITTGIDSYLSKKYVNGCLAGYLLDGNIDQTINGINSLLVKDKRNTEILNKRSLEWHDSYYESLHPEIQCLKHLIFDFTLK